MALIDREEVKRRVEAVETIVCGGRQNGKGMTIELMRMYRDAVLRAIEEVPTVDAVPVVHAEWISGNETPYCSNCDVNAIFSSGHNYELTDRCPSCGAHMDGGNQK